MLAWHGTSTAVHGTLQSCTSCLSCSVAHIGNVPIQLLIALSMIRIWEMGSLPLQGGQLPCHKPRNTGLHLWKYEQKCDRRTRQMARTRVNPNRCLSSSPRSSLCFCWLLPPRHSSKGGREPNSSVRFWTVGKIAWSFSHSNYFRYL